MGEFTIKSDLANEPSRPALAFDAQGRLSAGLFVEHCRRLGDKAVLNGWMVDASAASPNLKISGDAIDRSHAITIARMDRPDVDHGYALSAGMTTGFVAVVPLSASVGPAAPLEVSLTPDAAISCRATASASPFDDRFIAAIAPKLGFVLKALFGDAAAVRSLTPAIAAASRSSAAAVGAIEAARAVPEIGGLIVGWAIGLPQTSLLLARDDGVCHWLDDAVRTQRSDIVGEHGQTFGQFSAAAGFLIGAIGPAQIGSTLRLVAIEGDQLALIDEAAWTPAPQDAVSFARWSSDAAPLGSNLAARMDKHDGVIIEALRIRDAAFRRSRAAAATADFGVQLASPEFSVVVPIQGRFDSIHNQLIEFESDDAINGRAELIFAVNDPDAHARLLTQAPSILASYDIPFRIVGGADLGGLAAAMNAGAAVARAPLLLFMAANVIPTAPGWTTSMRKLIEGDPALGVVGSRLLHSSGAIRHDGLSLVWQADLSAFAPKVIGDGAPPVRGETGPNVACDAVSASCLLTTRAAFTAAGGFDETLLLPLFVAADYALKLKNSGLGVACVIDTSIVSLHVPADWVSGSDSFMNCIRHLATRKLRNDWGRLLPKSAETRA